VPALAVVHRPSCRPPTREAVTVAATQYVAGQSPRLLDPSVKSPDAASVPCPALIAVHGAVRGALANSRVVGSSRAAS
jgi:hypothetical protein